VERADGRLRDRAFAAGTLAIMRALAESDATTIVGGGDTDTALHKAGLFSRMSYVSTGGGAFLELLEGKRLPGSPPWRSSRGGVHQEDGARHIPESPRRGTAVRLIRSTTTGITGRRAGSVRRRVRRLFRELSRLEAAHPELADPDSPTRRVGAEPVEAFGTVVRDVPMLSLQNAFSDAELRAFDARVRRFLKGRGIGEEILDRGGYVAEVKIDGLAVELTYEDGEYVRGAPGGRGAGEDVTRTCAPSRRFPSPCPRTGRREASPRHASTAGGKCTWRGWTSGAEPEAGSGRGAGVRQPPGTPPPGSVRQLDPRVTASRRLKLWVYAPGGRGVARHHPRGKELALLAALIPREPGVEPPVPRHRRGRRVLREVEAGKDSLPYEIDGIRW